MSRRIEDGIAKLRELPDLEPPRELEASTLAAMANAAADLRRPMPLAWAAVWVAAIGSAAVIAALLIETSVGPVARSLLDDESAALQTSVPLADEARTPADGVPALVADDTYLALVAESSELERMLAALPPPRGVMRASTAGTIVDLENRIAVIDLLLTAGQAGGIEPAARDELMQGRVDAMNALVHVRYAQSRAFQF
ncbi:MAG: hypothetical protein R3305_02545 [Gammaproteobacteria bacterium]|nr:hypothetical protein [Gammaproteobacteria bacterium]